MSVATASELFPQACREVVASQAAPCDQAGGFPDKSIEALRQAGLLGLTVSTDLEGLGQGPVEFAAVVEQIAEADASVAMIFLMHVCATEVIKQSAMPRRDEVLRAIASGRHLSTLAFSEKGSRSHFWISMASVREEGGQDVVAVEKSFVTTAGHADSYLVSIRSAKAVAPTDSSIYYIEPRDGSATVLQPWEGLGLRGNASSPVTFHCKASASDLVTPDGGGFNVMLSVVLPWFQLGSASVANGIGRAALEATGRHLQAAMFDYSGDALASLPTVRARFAAARVRLDASCSLTRDTARAIAHPNDLTMLRVLECKAEAAETVLLVTDAAMRLCGGAAFARHLPVERCFRDARACNVMAPTTDVLYEFIGKSLLGLPLF